MALAQRRLGKADFEISVIGLGTVKFGRNQGVKNKHQMVLRYLKILRLKSYWAYVAMKA